MALSGSKPNWQALKFQSQVKMAAHLLFITDIPPSEGSGSGIILKRHIENFLKAGMHVTLCIPFFARRALRDLSPEINTIVLPSRKWWYPPARKEIQWTLALRARINAKLVGAMIRSSPPSHIFTLLWGESPRTAKLLSRFYNIPLLTIMHDQQEFWSTSCQEKHDIVSLRAKVILQSSYVYGVSAEILDVAGVTPRQKRIVYPIPGKEIYFDGNAPKPKKSKIEIFHAGSLHNWQIPNFCALASSLRNVDGRLNIVCQANNSVWTEICARFPETKRFNPPDRNEDVVSLLSQEATAFLVSYCFDVTEQPWSQTSFPSKLVDFARAGVPALILAPPQTAIHNWCKAMDFGILVDNISEQNIIKNIESLVSNWTQFAQNIRNIARGDFSAYSIQARLTDDVTFLENPQTTQANV